MVAGSNKSNWPTRRRSVHVCREGGTRQIDKSNGKIADCETQEHATTAGWATRNTALTAQVVVLCDEGVVLVCEPFCPGSWVEPCQQPYWAAHRPREALPRGLVHLIGWRGWREPQADATVPVVKRTVFHTVGWYKTKSVNQMKIMQTISL